jgi:hypothetical protein
LCRWRTFRRRSPPPPCGRWIPTDSAVVERQRLW